jgi:hypothetical protein
MKAKPKLDLYKLHKAEYATPKTPVLLQTRPTTYLAISGQGAPGDALFTASIGALYGMAFTIKMTRKFAGQQDYTVCKLEGQWWTDGAGGLPKVPRQKWRWKLLIRTPDFVTKAELGTAVTTLLKRGKTDDVKRVRLQPLKEGQCVQMLHVGPYEREVDSIQLMKELAESKGLKFAGKHHEIYLSDPRRVAPERLKTILRQPVRRA